MSPHTRPGRCRYRGQVVYVLELARKLGQLGYTVDLYTRRFEDQPEFDEVDERVRVVRIPCGGRDFIPKEYLHRHLMEWCENALRFIKKTTSITPSSTATTGMPAWPGSGSPKH